MQLQKYAPYACSLDLLLDLKKSVGCTKTYCLDMPCFLDNLYTWYEYLSWYKKIMINHFIKSCIFNAFRIHLYRLNEIIL